MSGEFLIMDDGRAGSGGGGEPPGGGGSDGGSPPVVVGNGDANSVSVTSPPQRILRNFKGHRGGTGRHHTYGQGNKSFQQSRKGDQQRLISSSEAENHLPLDRNHRRSTNQATTGSVRRSPTSPPPQQQPTQPRRRVRKEKGKWKPYHTLSFAEQKERDALETQRAEEKRSQRTHLGYPQAPYNTTQFLMNDHRCEYGASDGMEVPSSDESSTAEEDWTSMDRGYDQEYERVSSELLNSMSKSELIAHVLTTEKEKTQLEHRLRALEKEVSDLTPKLDGNFSGDETVAKELAMEGVS